MSTRWGARMNGGEAAEALAAAWPTAHLPCTRATLIRTPLHVQRSNSGNSKYIHGSEIETRPLGQLGMSTLLNACRRSREAQDPLKSGGVSILRREDTPAGTALAPAEGQAGPGSGGRCPVALRRLGYNCPPQDRDRLSEPPPNQALRVTRTRREAAGESGRG